MDVRDFRIEISAAPRSHARASAGQKIQRTHSDVDGVAGWRADQLSGEPPLDPVATAVAALLEGLHVGQRQLRPHLGVVRPLRDQRYGHALPVEVEVADVVTQQDAAAETDGLPGSEHSVRGQQGEGGN